MTNVLEFLSSFQAKPYTDSVVNAKLGSWVVWGLYDGVCKECSTPLFLIAESDSTSDVSKTALICLSAKDIVRAPNYQLEVSNVIKSRLDLALDQLGVLGINLGFLDASKVPQIQVEIGGVSESSDVPLPEGFRSVGWIKPDEAATVIKCFATKSNQELTNEKGRVVFVARYVPDSDPDSRKYHSNCEASRVKVNGGGRKMWIRESEALAVREADELRRTIEYSHTGFGNGGIVEYFEPSHPAAKRYLSTTRLLRRY